MLKPSLQLRLGQQLTMTPQLQQAIRLLQLPALELQAHIRELLESNVMLEPMEDSEGTGVFETIEEPNGGAERERVEHEREQAATPERAPMPGGSSAWTTSRVSSTSAAVHSMSGRSVFAISSRDSVM